MRLPITLFATSFTLVIAAGLVQLDAGPDADGPDRKPALHQVTVGGHALELTLDRERVPAGESVKVSIVAREGGVRERVRVALLEQGGSAMSRSMPPPREVFHQEVEVGQAPVTLALKLRGPQRGTAAGVQRGAKPDPLLSAGRATQYTVVVTAAGEARDGDGGAYLPVFAYEPEAYRLEIEPLAAGAPGDTVDLAVKVTSLAKQPLRGISVGASSDLVTIDEAARIEALAPGEQRVVHLRGVRQAVGAEPALIQAYGYAEYGGTAGAWATIDATHGTLVARASEPSQPDMFGMF